MFQNNVKKIEDGTEKLKHKSRGEIQLAKGN